MLKEVAIAVFTLNSPLYDRLADAVRGLADRVSQFSYQDRMDSLQAFARDGDLIVIFDTSKQRDTCLRWIRKLCEFRPNARAASLEEEFNQEYSLQAIRAGVRDFLVGNFTAEEAKALIRRLIGSFEHRQLPSTILAILGTAGGCGANAQATAARHVAQTVRHDPL